MDRNARLHGSDGGRSLEDLIITIIGRYITLCARGGSRSTE